MPSFSFPNMLPNMMAANMMGLGNGVNFLQQQTQQFQSQLQQQSNQPQRKSLFAPYLPQASLPPLLAAGKLVVGILRVNKRNRSDAYVSTEVLDADIYICGSKDRNRALEGDIVAVELLDVDEVWATKKEKEEKKRKKEENSAYESKNAVGRKNDKKKDDVEVEGQGLMLFEDEEVTDEVKPQFAGHVVAVVERMPGQLFSGTLGLLRPSSAATKEKQEAERREREGDRGDEPRRPIERPKIVWFKPTDKRVPLIAIPTEQAPADFVQNPDAYANKLFVACIKRHVSPPLDSPMFRTNLLVSCSPSALFIRSVPWLRNSAPLAISRSKPARCSRTAISRLRSLARTCSSASPPPLGCKRRLWHVTSLSHLTHLVFPSASSRFEETCGKNESSPSIPLLPRTWTMRCPSKPTTMVPTTSVSTLLMFRTS